MCQSDEEEEVVANDARNRARRAYMVGVVGVYSGRLVVRSRWWTWKKQRRSDGGFHTPKLKTPE